MSGQRRVGAALRARAWDKFDLAAGMSCDPAGEVGDRDLFGGADMIDAEMLALVAHHHDARDEIVDMAEAAGLPAVALDLERHLAALVLAGAARFSRSANCGTTCSKPMSGP